MRSLSARQQTILASKHKSKTWLFDVLTASGQSYYWSTRTIRAFRGVPMGWEAGWSWEPGMDWGAAVEPLPSQAMAWESGMDWEPGIMWGGDITHDYQFRIIDFSGITLHRSSSEVGIITPSELSFAVAVADGSITVKDLIDASLLVTLRIGDDAGDDVFRRFRFQIKRVEPSYGTIKVIAQDWFSSILKGSYPNNPNPAACWLSTSTDDIDDYCIPWVFGTAYIPLRSAYINSTIGRAYVLGIAGPTYTVQRVRSPRAYSAAKNEWLASGYSFVQDTVEAGGVQWRVVRPIIADANGDGTADSTGLWSTSSAFMDAPFMFSRSDTAGMTSPADVLAAILKGMGVPADYIGADAFASAKAKFAAWGLTWNGGLYRQEDRQALLSRLLAACHGTLSTEEQIELRALSMSPVMTITAADVTKSQDIGPGTFTYSSQAAEASDSGYAEWQPSGEAQDQGVKILVPAKASTASPDTSPLDLLMVQDSILVQKLACLYWQRKYLKTASVTLSGKSRLCMLQPDDAVTISGANYGGSYDVVIDSITIKPDLAVDLECSRYAAGLDDFEDLTFSAVTPTTDTTDTAKVWTLKSAGPGGLS